MKTLKWTLRVLMALLCGAGIAGSLEIWLSEHHPFGGIMAIFFAGALIFLWIITKDSRDDY